MEIIAQTKDFRINFNGGNSYLVVDSAEQCVFATNTVRKAKNYLRRLLNNTNSNETI